MSSPVEPSLQEAYPSESSDTVACAGSVVCHNAPTLRGLSEQLGPGLQAPFSGLGLELAPLSPSRQMLTRLTPPVWHGLAP